MNFGIYVHHPWCIRKCAYCAFNVYTDPSPPFGEWKQYIERDWREERKFVQGNPYSLYFGGGTPSLSPVPIIADLISLFSPKENAEVTLEINPGDIQRSYLEELQQAGVNRYSIGIQSFQKRFSKLLNRSHTVEDNHNLLTLLSQCTPKTWSLDLIFGLPDQTLEELIWDIDQALAHEPPHISIYGLTIEENTPLQRAVQRGVISPLEDERWEELFGYIMERLAKEGYEQYEISNFAREGHRSQHNEHIWKNGHYVGLGPSAHGFRPDGARTIQHAHWEKWKQADHFSVDYPTKKQALLDTIITQIRHIDGFSLEIFNKHGLAINYEILTQWEKMKLILVDGQQLSLLPKGRFFADWITGKMFEEFIGIED